MMSEPAILCRRISKRFRLGRNSWAIRGLMKRLGFHRHDPGPATHDSAKIWALRNVCLKVSPGESVGVIGPNGAGKSTLLRLFARVLKPDAGELRVRGRVTALIEVGAGFHPELTGRENVFLSGSILGMRRAEIRSKLDAIVDFAGIGRFLDVPVKRYSSGMHARLGFSIAAHVDPEILLVDEVLSVGDAAFRLRCMERMRELLSGGTTLVLVTHHLDQMTGVCKRAIVLDGGRVAFDGAANEAAGHYMRAVSQAHAIRATDVVEGEDQRAIVGDVQLRLQNDRRDEAPWFRAGEAIRAEVSFCLRERVDSLLIELNVRAASQELVLSFNTGRANRSLALESGRHQVLLTIPEVPLCSGQYFWNVRMWDGDRGATLVDTPMCFPMVMDDEGKGTGRLALRHEWARITGESGEKQKSAPIETTLAPVTLPREKELVG
ncbi:MAG: polysaccharide ABC transporter ATP-binding protein [Planctomycetota bacterium]